MSPRRRLDFYPTPQSLTLALIDARPDILSYPVYEPCNGKGAISRPFRQLGCGVTTADIDPLLAAEQDYVLDARRQRPPSMAPSTWAVTNPPFSGAMAILANLWADHRIMGVALLLRLSFLEPVADREEFLVNHPPSQLIVLPRTSFTEDGKTDSVTCAWMVFEKGRYHCPIRVYTKSQLKQLLTNSQCPIPN